MEKDHNTKYARYVLFLLTGVAAFAFIDKQLVTLLQESIKEELGLTDTQLGFASGLAFSMFYVALGIPVGYLADRYNRKKIIVVAMTIWSSLTALTGLVGNYWQLVLARMGMGIGETGANPPAYSLIADYFPAEKRGKAYGVYGTGIYIGMIFGLVIGGIVSEYYGWRAAFYAIGIPSVLFAMLIHFTLKEPLRGQMDKKVATTTAPPFLEVLEYLATKRTFLFLAAGVSLHTLVGMGLGNWAASFLSRMHGLDTMEAGLWLAGSAALGGISGTFLGGYFADKWAKIDKRWYFWLSAIAISINLPLMLSYLFVTNKVLLFSLDVVCTFLFTCTLAPTFAILQELVTPRMRGTASAVLGIVMNLLGMGTGPLLVGAISDWLAPTYSEFSLRWALFYVGFIEILAVLFFIQAAKTLKRDLVS